MHQERQVRPASTLAVLPCSACCALTRAKSAAAAEKQSMNLASGA